MILSQVAFPAQPLSRLYAWLLPAVLLLWLLSPTLAGLWYDYPRLGPARSFLTLLMACCLFVSPILILRTFPHVFTLWLPVALIAPVIVFFTIFFQGAPGDPLTSSLLHTNPREVRETLGGFGWYPYLIPVTWLTYLVLLWRSFPGRGLAPSDRKKAFVFLVFYVLLAVLPDPREPSGKLLPTLFDKEGVATLFPLSSLLSLARVLDVPSDDITIRQLGASAPSDPQLIVLVVGETLRPDHLGINGYTRETTPRLSAMRSSLLSFSNVASTANFTAIAIKNLLHRIEGTGAISLVSTFQEAGFQTAWISNQDRPIYMPGTDLTYIADTSWSTGTRLDSSLLPIVDAAMRRQEGRQLIIVHIMGSHFPYELRYGREDAVFLPAFDGRLKASVSLAKKQELINAYDNSIRATDRFLAEVIAKAGVNKRPALVMFTADHGENLYDDERNLVLHSGLKPSRFETFVPLVVWANEAYQEKHPDKMAALRMHRDAAVSHLDLMPSLKDLASITYPGMDARRSLASRDFTPLPKREVWPNKSGVPVDVELLR